jgi:signal-transduction protein with cAMP-binding, CBS, and nucleotidyltransferase domain
MDQVRDIIAIKGNTVCTIDKDATVFDAIKKMVENGVGSIIVMDGEATYGIFTERDYLRRIVLEGRTSKTTRAAEVTTQRLIVVEPTCTLDDCMALMTRERIRHLPVIEGGRLVGILSIGDIVKSLTKHQASEIRYLTDYISGKYPG